MEMKGKMTRKRFLAVLIGAGLAFSFSAPARSAPFVRGDAAVLDRDAGTVTVFRGGPGGLTPVKEIPVADRPRCAVAADADGDGFCDLLVFSGDSRTVTLLRGTAGGLVLAGEFAAEDEPGPCD